MNIALIKQYHENMDKTKAKKLSLDLLNRIGLAHIAYRRNPSLLPDERFCVMVLRAAMLKDAVIVIDRPFKILPHSKTSRFITNVLKEIDDLYTSCHIYDYSWMEEKHGDL